MESGTEEFIHKRHWLTCLGCGWIKSVDLDPPISDDGFCITCGEPAEDPFDIAREDRAAQSYQAPE